jgi:hypothetical protein
MDGLVVGDDGRDEEPIGNEDIGVGVYMKI